MSENAPASEKPLPNAENTERQPERRETSSQVIGETLAYDQQPAEAPRPTGPKPADFLAPPQADDELGRLGSYRVLKQLGAGGMGMMFLAEDMHLRRKIALKVMSPLLAADDKARQRFLREAQATAALHHDHVVTIYQVAEDRGVPFLAMELLAGESLEARLHREGKLPLAEALRLGREIASGLDAAHEQGLIHRDIKPANIWLEARKEPRPIGSGGTAATPEARKEPRPIGSGGTAAPLPIGRGSSVRVKILDFGLAHLESGDQRLTQSGLVLGTPSYMSPEQAGGEHVDQRSDLFSLGCVLYRMITGKLAFEGANVRSILKALMFEKPAPLLDLVPDVPPALSRLIEQLLAKEPKDRPQSAAEVVEALAALEAELAQHPQPAATIEYRPTETASTAQQGKDTMTAAARSASKARRRLAAAVIGLVVLGLGGLWLGPVIYHYFKPTPDQVPPVSEPFVILAKDGRPEKAVATLADAVAAAQSGDTIEIRGDGPFVLAPIELKSKALTLRAGKDCRPVLSLAPEDVAADLPQLTTEAALTLEGLEFRRDGTGKPGAYLPGHIDSRRGPVAVTHCRFVYRNLLASDAPWNARNYINAVRPDQCPSFQVRHCQFLGDWNAGPAGEMIAESRMLVANCLFLGPLNGVGFGALPNVPQATLELRHNTMIMERAVVIHTLLKEVPGQAQDRPVWKIAAKRNLCTSGLVRFHLRSDSKQADTFLDRNHRSFARRLTALEDEGNHLGTGALVTFAIIHKAGDSREEAAITGLDEWKEFWKLDKVRSIVGKLQFQRADLAPDMPAPEKLSPQDFRLVTDDPKLKDYGADVDLVGPGKAYEKWKKTKEYKQWLKDTGQVSAAKPFVILARDGRPEKAVATLQGAVAAAQSGDTIEVNADGPPITKPIKITGKALTIRAAPNAAPTLLLKRNAAKDPAVNIETDSSLTLEGLAFHAIDAVAPMVYARHWGKDASLRVANCRFLVTGVGCGGTHVLAGEYSSQCEVRNCQATNSTDGRHIFLSNQLRSNGRIVLDNNVCPDHHVAIGLDGTAKEATLELTHNSLMSIDPSVADKAGGSVRIDARENVFGDGVLNFGQEHDKATAAGAKAEALLRRLVVWREKRNAYSGTSFLQLWKPGQLIEPTKDRRTLAEWEEFWGIADTGSLQGVIKFQGGDVWTKAKKSPEALVPADFRLAEGSIGKGKRADGKDLGADVDLVGPGKAYEKWKQTKGYQQWLKDTGQVSAAKPFVILAKGGRSEQAVATLQGAVAAAQSGDTIEIRGDGPFVLPPIELKSKALTLRAGKDCRPVLSLAPEAVAADLPQLTTEAALTLEGLEFHREGTGKPGAAGLFHIHSRRAQIAITHCRFVYRSLQAVDLPLNARTLFAAVWAEECSSLHVRHSLFLGDWEEGLHQNVWLSSESRMLVDNCLFLARNPAVVLGIDPQVRRKAVVQLRNNTMLLPGRAVWIGTHVKGAAKPAETEFTARIEAERNLCTAGFLGFAHWSFSRETDDFLDLEHRSFSRRLIALEDNGNYLGDGANLVTFHMRDSTGKFRDLGSLTGVDQWQEFWKLDKVRSTVGKIRFQRADLAAGMRAPDKLTPQDFRLKTDDPKLKGFGADVDLVGPGPAYDRWRQTGAYQQWLRDIGWKK